MEANLWESPLRHSSTDTETRQIDTFLDAEDVKFEVHQTESFLSRQSVPEELDYDSAEACSDEESVIILQEPVGVASFLSIASERKISEFKKYGKITIPCLKDCNLIT